MKTLSMPQMLLLKKMAGLANYKPSGRQETQVAKALVRRKLATGFAGVFRLNPRGNAFVQNKAGLDKKLEIRTGIKSERSDGPPNVKYIEKTTS